MEGGMDWSTARDALQRLDVLTATTDRANQGLESELHRLVEELHRSPRSQPLALCDAKPDRP